MVDVTNPARPELDMPGTADRAGRKLIDVGALAQAIAAAKAEARAAGLTDADIDAELAAWKAERRARR